MKEVLQGGAMPRAEKIHVQSELRTTLNLYMTMHIFIPCCLGG